ncbi:MAG: hypothetical protein IJJ14_01920 [Coriobacteriales bacterium]|nr:hypothetical protein [Coriobacteriales bacterium]MBQ6585529.1 hypothetical protein [Coriobacteriales bacterium]
MLDTDARIRLVESRVHAQRRAAVNRSISVLSSACAALVVGIVGLIASFSHASSGDVIELYGSSLLFSDAGGYVLVGVISFVAAVAITLGCISYRRKSEQRAPQDRAGKDVDHD